MNFDELPPDWRGQLAIDGSAEQPCLWLRGAWELRDDVPRYAAIAPQLANARRVSVGARDLERG